jgi:hypothetical protein
MKNKIYEASDLPEDEKIYLTKRWVGWDVVEPFEDPITGKKNWFAGTKKMIVPLLFILLILTLFLIGFRESTTSMRSALDEIFSDPEIFCRRPEVVCKPEWRAAGLCQYPLLLNSTNSLSLTEGSSRE